LVSLPIFIPPIAPQSPSSIIWGWYNRPVVAAVPSGLNLTPLTIIKTTIVMGGELGQQVFISRMGSYFSQCHYLQMASRIPEGSYRISTRWLSGRGMKLTTHLHLLLHGSESSSNHQFLSYSQILQYFMEPEK
jgi:hypothetical protein